MIAAKPSSHLLPVMPISSVELRKIALRTILLTLVAACFCGTVTAQNSAESNSQSGSTAKAATDDSVIKTNRKVIVKTSGAELRTPGKVVWRAYLGETYTITMQKDEWLWVMEKRGWLWDQHTLPFETAIEDTTGEIEKHKTAAHYHLRGVAYLAHEKPQKAIEDFNASLKLKPGIAGVLNNRGTAWYQQQKYDKAKADFSAAIAASKTHFVAYNNRALCEIAVENNSSALKDLDIAISMNKEYPEALNSRGVIYSRQGDFAKAIVDFTSALKIYDGYVEALGNRSYAYRQTGEFAKAIADLELAMVKAPKSYQPINDLAWIYATAKDKKIRNSKKAVELATKACDMTQQKNWNALDTLAASCAADGDFKQAKKWISAAIKNAPSADQAALKEHQDLFKKRKAINGK